MNNLIIFDLDGVITSEEAYWDAAGMTLHELLYSPRYWNIEQSGPGSAYHPVTTAQETRRVSRSVFPEPDIMTLKARAINSNWDTCYSTVCLHLIDMLARFPDIAPLLPLKPWDAAWLKQFRSYEPDYDAQLLHLSISAVFDEPVFRGYVGLDLINRFDAYASEKLEHDINGVFSRHSPFWTFCQSIFQEWYLGDDLYAQTYGHAPMQSGKPGCIHFERPLLPIEQLRSTLETLREQGYTLGAATGRVRQEALMPLKMYGLLPCFDEFHMGTYDFVERAEAQLRAKGDTTLLSKPHPFQFLIAIDSNYDIVRQRNAVTQTTQKQQDSVIVVGDSTSDILGGRAAGALTVAVLTGVRTQEARELLIKSKPDFTIEDVTKLPALLGEMDSLATIQRLQFTDKSKAERLLQRWLARHMQLVTESVTLTPKAVSLNSFNGFYRARGEDYFFKTHVEEQGVLEEYYHAELLCKAGYNTVVPLRTLHQEGRQMVIYPVVQWPVMFDLMRDVETGKATDGISKILIEAERRESERLLDIYLATLAQSSADENARAPVHQLFWHRITGGRLDNFYTGKAIALPDGRHISFEAILTKQWVINGIAYQQTLGELLERASIVLDPRRAAMTVIGHGDAHFGNVFLEHKEDEYDYLYFDPAFAGRHSPLLDIVKPFFHNVFATWMYFPEDIAANLHLSATAQGDKLQVEHDYTLTPIRQAILRTKIEHLLRPLIRSLQAKQALPDDWQEILRLALLCCPLLTINLFDTKRMPETISWLGLSFAVQMGNSGIVSEGNEV